MVPLRLGFRDMKTNEKTAGVIILAIGGLLLFYLYSQGQLGAAVTQDTGANTGQPSVVIDPTVPNVTFQSVGQNVNVVSYVPLFGFIGVGPFWS